MLSGAEVMARLVALTPAQRAAALGRLNDAQIERLRADWEIWAHAGQRAPEGDWRTWVIMAGRGFGKTRAGAEWVLGVVRGAGASLGDGDSPRGTVPMAVRGDSPRGTVPGVRVALVAATVDEARRVMIEGPSGLLALAGPDDIADWSPSLGRVRFKAGGEAFLFSGASPEKLRGAEHDFAWCDELAKWRHPKACWDMLQMGLRRGARPRAVVTTTPRPGTVLDTILARPDTAQTGGATWTNPHLPEAFIAAMQADYGGTRLARQELEGVLLREVEGSLWPLDLIERCRVERFDNWDCRARTVPDFGVVGRGQSARDSPRGTVPALRRIVIGVDPPASASGTCGIVVCAVTAADRALVLADLSVSSRSPEGWAQAVAEAAALCDADRIVAERNMGGDMVAAVLRAAQPALPLTLVHASHGKVRRAEPVAALFEQRRAAFAGRFPALEAELHGLMIGGGYAGPGVSPDRADACVWALTALMLGVKAAEPRIRML